MKKTFLIALNYMPASAVAFEFGFFAEPVNGSVFSGRSTTLGLRR